MTNVKCLFPLHKKIEKGQNVEKWMRKSAFGGGEGRVQK